MASTCPWSRSRSRRNEAESALADKLKLEEMAEEAIWLAPSEQGLIEAILNNNPNGPDSPKGVVTIYSGVRP